MFIKSSYLDGQNVHPMGIAMVRNTSVCSWTIYYKCSKMGKQTNKSHKMGPGRMREMLIAKYPDRLDIPSESELWQAISKFIVQVKKEKYRH